jgi:hypothetical protein
MTRARRLLTATFVAVAACGVELGEPPDVDNDDDDGKSDEGGGGGGGGGGNGGGGGSGSGAMPLTATAFLTKIGVQYCDECFRCKANYPDGATAFTQDFGASTSECYAGTDAYYAPSLVEQSIIAGRVTYNAMSAQACLAGVVYQASCSVFWQNPPQFPASCDQALVGKIADGAACVSIFDCANLTSACDQSTKKCTPQ